MTKSHCLIVTPPSPLHITNAQYKSYFYNYYNYYCSNYYQVETYCINNQIWTKIFNLPLDVPLLGSTDFIILVVLVMSVIRGTKLSLVVVPSNI